MSFIFKQPKNGLFLKEINSYYISILFFVYFDFQTKSSVSKSKQTANYVKKGFVDSVLGVAYDEPDISSDCCKTICFYKAKLIYCYL
jgi:hypothetical protein